LQLNWRDWIAVWGPFLVLWMAAVNYRLEQTGEVASTIVTLVDPMPAEAAEPGEVEQRARRALRFRLRRACVGEQGTSGLEATAQSFAKWVATRHGHYEKLAVPLPCASVCRPTELCAARKIEALGLSIYRELVTNTLTYGIIQLLAMCSLPLAFYSMMRSSHPSRSRLPAEATSPAARLLADLPTLRMDRAVREARRSVVSMGTLAIFMTWATSFVLAPKGFRSSILLEFVQFWDPETENTFPAIVTSFGDAPPLMFALLGYLVYMAIIISHGSRLGSIGPATFNALALRGVVVGSIGIALDAYESSTVVNTAAFLSSILPDVSWSLLSKTAGGAGAGAPFAALDPITEQSLAKRAALEEAGIESLSDLATRPLRETLVDVRLEPMWLARAVDKALLHSHCTPAVWEEAARHNVGTASGLIGYCAAHADAPSTFKEACRALGHDSNWRELRLVLEALEAPDEVRTGEG
jgi:hypothetical protein